MSFLECHYQKHLSIEVGDNMLTAKHSISGSLNKWHYGVEKKGLVISIASLLYLLLKAKFNYYVYSFQVKTSLFFQLAFLLVNIEIPLWNIWIVSSTLCTNSAALFQLQVCLTLYLAFVLLQINSLASNYLIHMHIWLEIFCLSSTAYSTNR